MEFSGHVKQSSKDWSRIGIQEQQQHYSEVNCQKCCFCVFLVLFCYGLRVDGRHVYMLELGEDRNKDFLIIYTHSYTGT